MTHRRSSQEMRDHDAISALIPWYVNGTLGELDRQRVDEHVRACALCRDDLLVERRIHQSMAADAGVEYMPAASLKRLQARLDELDAKAAPLDAPVTLRPARRPVPWQGLMAASIAVLALAVSLLAADRWLQYRARALQPDFYTVTTSTPRAPDEVIRAVFSPAITLAELQGILDESGLRIISGPTPAGVYSLAPTSDRPVGSSLALLRRHATVRFAESTRPASEPSGSP
jgi:hypothetical protein